MKMLALYIALCCLSIQVVARQSKQVCPQSDLIKNFFETKRASGITHQEVWMLSIGINDYGEIKSSNCESDANNLVTFFQQQYLSIKNKSIENFHSFTLLGKMATRDSILKVLRHIASMAGKEDYFIFNFNGISSVKDWKGYEGSYFFPYDVITEGMGVADRKTRDTINAIKSTLSLKVLQEHIQRISATNQMIIIEAGPCKDLKTEFTKVLLQTINIENAETKNRVIIVPNTIGLDETICNSEEIKKGPINFVLTSLDTSLNIYKLFYKTADAGKVANAIKKKGFDCDLHRYSTSEYFDIIFEQELLNQYRQLSGRKEAGIKEAQSR